MKLCKILHGVDWIAGVGFALAMMPQPVAAAGQEPDRPAACALSAPVVARPAQNIVLRWKATAAPGSAGIKLGNATIAANVSSEGQMSIAAPADYGTHVYAMTIAGATGSPSCTAEVFVAAQTDVAPPRQAFTWAYDISKSGLTDAEIRQLAENFAYVVLTKQDGDFSIDRRNIDAQKIKAVNRNVKVFSYIGMIARFRRAQFGDASHPPAFKDEWLLRPRTGGPPIAFTYGKYTPGWYVDLANPGYRAWLRSTFRNWFLNGHYDGIAFDNTLPIYSENQRKPQLRHVDLSSEEIAAYNKGLHDILVDAKRVGRENGSSGEVIFNGVENVQARANRSLDLFEFADIALNEQFCIAQRQGRIMPRAQLQADITMMEAGKRIQEHVKYGLWDAGIPNEQVSRFCYAVFMMGYKPSYDFFKFSTSDQGHRAALSARSRIYDNAAEIHLDLGNPAGRYTDGPVWKRDFERGTVYVNPDDVPHSVAIGKDAVLMNGNKPGGKAPRGTNVSVPPHDALFYLYSPPPTGQR